MNAEIAAVFDDLPPADRMEDVAPAMGAIPAVGAHRESILAELGFDAETIERWKQEGMIWF